MDSGPEYQRAETRYETNDPRLARPYERRVATARSTHVSPAQIITGLAGIVLLVIGLIAVAKGGLSGPITDPVVDVAGFSHTPLLGLIEAGVGLVLLGCALWGSRASGVFMGTVVAVAGIVVAATPSSFSDTLATEASYGWFLVILGAVVAVACLAIPDWSSRRTVVYN
jgi:hypothetical protein